MFDRIVKNAAWNLGGFVLPAAVAFLAVPILVHLIGTERFGALSLCWAVVGMFSVLDLGLGRALTGSIAEVLDFEDRDQVADIISTTLRVALLISALLALLVLVVAIATDWTPTSVSEHLEDEMRPALILLSIGVALTVYGSVLRGGLEGFSDFRSANLIKIPAGILMFVLPILTALFTPHLAVAVGGLVVARAGTNIGLMVLLRRRIDYPRARFRRELVVKLVNYGGWITVSNIISPLIVFADRFVIGAVLSASAVAYYSAPADALSRVLVIPISLSVALFPTFAARTLDRAQLERVFRASTLFVFSILAPFAVICVIFATPILQLWIGPEFADNSTRVFQVLAVAFCLNGLGQVPFLALQATGRSKMVALSHAAQLLPYLAAVYLAAIEWGIIGVAVVWCIRVAVDMSFLTIMWLLTIRRMSRPEGAA